jgi:hypothetical protein
MLSIIVDPNPISVQKLEDFARFSDASVSRLGQGLLLPGIDDEFDQPMLQIFRQARLVWM